MREVRGRGEAEDTSARGREKDGGTNEGSVEGKVGESNEGGGGGSRVVPVVEGKRREGGGGDGGEHKIPRTCLVHSLGGMCPCSVQRRPASTPPSRVLSVPPLASVALDGQLSAHATPLVLPGGFTRCFSLRRDRPRRRRRVASPCARQSPSVVRDISADDERVPAFSNLL